MNINYNKNDNDNMITSIDTDLRPLTLQRMANKSTLSTEPLLAQLAAFFFFDRFLLDAAALGFSLVCFFDKRCSTRCSACFVSPSVNNPRS
jgi:hypothetical protein